MTDVVTVSADVERIVIVNPTAPNVVEIIESAGTETVVVREAEPPQILEIVSPGPQGPRGERGVGTVFTTPEPPENPEPGWKWIDPETGCEFTWILDGTTGCWIEVGASGLVINGVATSFSDAVSTEADNRLRTGTDGKLYAPPASWASTNW